MNKKTFTNILATTVLSTNIAFANYVTPLEMECNYIKTKIEEIISQFERNCIEWNLRNGTNFSFDDYINWLPEFCSSNPEEKNCINLEALLKYYKISKQKNCKLN